jgi:serine/threonine-protein phosphatase 2A regulatory subunit B'
MIDVLDENEASDVLLSDKIVAEAFKMICSNLFRTFTNKSNQNYSQVLDNKKTTAVDPDEDEPHLEEAWPHLQLVYELLLKLIMHNFQKSEIILKYLNKSFVKSFLELFDSEDPRERDYLKTILHRVFGKFM